MSKNSYFNAESTCPFVQSTIAIVCVDNYIKMGHRFHVICEVNNESSTYYRNNNRTSSK
ncbi:hypothetical protein ALT1000_90157 [Alteromonas macleodii]